MSGYVAGSLWGLVLGGVGLAFVSQINEMPGAGTPPQAPLVNAPQAAATQPEAELVSPETPNPEPALSADVPRVAVPEAEIATPVTDTTPPSTPVAPDLTTALTLPEDVSTPDIAASLEAPEIPRTIVTPPAVPQPDDAVEVSTEPAAAPEPAEPDSNALAGVDDDSVTPPAEQPTTSDNDLDQDQDASSETPRTSIVEVPATNVAPPPVVAPEVAEDTQEAAQEDTAVLPEPAPEVAEVEPPTVPDPAPQQDAMILPTPEPPANAPEIITVQDTAQDPLPQVNSGVRVNRPGATPSETIGQDAEVVVEEDAFDDAPALVRFASAFVPAGDVPLMSILLLDDGRVTDAPAQVAALPFGTSVVIDALATNASERMRDYRDAGIEVLMQTSLPQGAVPTDVEVAFEAAFGILPETVALFSGAGGLLQSNRAVTSQVVEVLQAEGRGLIVVEQGLSNAIRTATQAGLPAAPVLRALDVESGNVAAIGRALDQAAFRARQAGDGVLLAQLTQPALDALQAWGAQNDGDQIALAPASAILQKSIVD